MARNALEEMMMDAEYLGCTCTTCKDDILAIALNCLPPHYSSRYVGETYTKAQLFTEQIKVDIIRELAKAAVIVTEHQRHA